MGRGLVFRIVVAFSCLYPSHPYTTNGLNMIGFASESIGTGGADLVVARDTTALNTNPAGLAQIPGSRLDWFGAYAYPIEVAHKEID